MSIHQNSDTSIVTISALLRAFQIFHTAISESSEKKEILRLEQMAVRAVKQLNIDEFSYDCQTVGIGEALTLLSGIFRHARQEL